MIRATKRVVGTDCERYVRMCCLEMCQISLYHVQCVQYSFPIYFLLVLIYSRFSVPNHCDCGTGWASEHSWFDSRARKVRFSRVRREAVESVHPSVQLLPGDISRAVKWPRRETGQSPPSNIIVKNKWS
jgi:hypothetical protein